MKRGPEDVFVYAGRHHDEYRRPDGTTYTVQRSVAEPTGPNAMKRIERRVRHGLLDDYNKRFTPHVRYRTKDRDHVRD